MNTSELVHEAVELAVKRNPHLVLEPYYQMKAAATILAEALYQLSCRRHGAVVLL